MWELFLQYPQYEGTLTSLYLHDLALLRLDVAVNVTDYVAPVTGLADEMSPDMPLECVVTGWGASGDSMTFYFSYCLLFKTVED